MPTLETKITSVTVFPDRARVTRAGALTLDAGVQTVSIANLPRALDKSSVRATGKGAARLTGIQTTLEHYAQAAPGAAKDAEDKVQTLRDQDRILVDEEDAWKQRLEVVKQIGAQGGENFSRGLSRNKLSLDGLTGVLDYLSQSHEAASNILRDLSIRRRDLARQIEAAQQEANKLRNAAALESYTVQVNLDMRERGDVEIEIAYTVYNASWEPLYDARLDGSQLEWNYFAQVQQQTGEDWNTPFALTLSTSTLATGLDKPELSPWRVGIYRPPELRPMQMHMRGAMADAVPAAAPAMAEMMVGAAPALQAKMEFAAAEVESSGPSVTYKIPAPRAIPSDGEPHQVAITTLMFDAALNYFTAPKVDEHVFVRAQLKNNSEYLMLEGQVNLYHGADFVGTRHIEPIVPGQEQEFFLGAEERLHVERKETKRAVDKNFVGNTGRTALAYRILVQNPSLDTARITVLDQIPVSAHPDIKVKFGKVTPDAQPNDQGELKWERTLKRGEKQTFEFEVTVEFPKDQRVVGL
jgi:uncharacterized protein (TIGR02231 family)